MFLLCPPLNSTGMLPRRRRINEYAHELGSWTYSPLPCLLSLLTVNGKAPLVPWLAWLAGRPLPGGEGGDPVPVPLLQRSTSESCGPAPALLSASLIPPPGQGPPPT